MTTIQRKEQNNRFKQQTDSTSRLSKLLELSIITQGQSFPGYKFFRDLKAMAHHGFNMGK